MGVTLAGWLGGGRNVRAGVGDKQFATQSFPLCSFASADGVPFLMHDEELTRTTNVRAVFPERAALNSTAFNWTDLQQLDAGSWFLEVRMPRGGWSGMGAFVSEVRALPWGRFSLQHWSWQTPGQGAEALLCLHKFLGCGYAPSWGLF